MANDPFLKDSKISVNSEIQYDQQDLGQAKGAIVTKYEKKKTVTNICTNLTLTLHAPPPNAQIWFQNVG